MSSLLNKRLLSSFCCARTFISTVRTMSSSAPLEVNLLKRTLTEDDINVDAKIPRTEPERIRKKKVAMLISYSGQGYLGMQRNPGTKTIEEDLLTAMLKAGIITTEAFKVPQTIHFQRAARTDKGVSAARQVLSLKLPEDTKVEVINEHLPEQVHVFAIKRTTKGFNCKSSCDARTYSYMLPTFAFAPEGVEPDESYRISPETIDNVNETLSIFKGTHNFHNFTSRKKPLDPSAVRYIINFECGEPFVSQGVEFCVVQVRGQSFMLHQIRKMVGLTVAIMRGLTPRETITTAWQPERLDLPVAPGLGLVLEAIHYDRYNEKFGKDGVHEPLLWTEVNDQVEAFKRKYIFRTIIETELKEKSMLEWLSTLPLHSYTVREEHVSNGLAALQEAANLLESSPDPISALHTLASVAEEHKLHSESQGASTPVTTNT